MSQLLRKVPLPAPFCVRSIPEIAQVIGISPATMQRLIARGDGPETIRLSPRRVGISDVALAAWLAKRTEKSAA
jgi:predicted DNA-binding transcriptional regulator AlpA